MQAVVGQQKQQDVRIASRCLWSDEHDNHASGQYNNVRFGKCTASIVILSLALAMGNVYGVWTVCGLILK